MESMDTMLTTRYCKELPTAQTALDIFKGVWKSSLPKELNLRTGATEHFFSDPRVLWANGVLPGGFSNLDILECGPFEGYDSYLFTKLGARRVTAIEANNINFLKCLLLKDTLELDILFMHGDFIKYLENIDTQFDLIWASGVLYHSERPIDLLARIADHTDRLFIWTHFFAETLFSDHNRQYFNVDKNIEVNFIGQTYTLHYRSYLNETRPEGLPLHYEGGSQSFAYWMSKDDIERLVRSLGFTDLRHYDHGEMSGMPYFGLLAQRNQSIL